MKTEVPDILSMQEVVHELGITPRQRRLLADVGDDGTADAQAMVDRYRTAKGLGNITNDRMKTFGNELDSAGVKLRRKQTSVWRRFSMPFSLDACNRSIFKRHCSGQSEQRCSHLSSVWI